MGRHYTAKPPTRPLTPVATEPPAAEKPAPSTYVPADAKFRFRKLLADIDAFDLKSGMNTPLYVRLLIQGTARDFGVPPEELVGNVDDAM